MCLKLTWEAFYRRPIPPHHRKKVGSFWWRHMSLSDHLSMMAACIVNERSSLYFWRDTWNLGVLQLKFLQLYSFALNKNILAKAFRSSDIQRHFWLSLLVEASEQLSELQILLNNLQSDLAEADKWTYIWNSRVYSSKKGYLNIIGINDASPIFQWM
jgi:hypothetical protein